MGAPLGNKNAIGNNGGCPARYKDPADMQSIIDSYFNRSKGELLKDDEGIPILDKYGHTIIVDQFPPTITGLALELGFTSRLALLNYTDKVEFINTISIAKARVEAYTEARLFDRDGVNGAKFSLTNNFKGWKDTQTIEQTGPNGGPLLIQGVSAMSDADLKLMAEIMERSQIAGEVVDITPEDDSK